MKIIGLDIDSKILTNDFLYMQNKNTNLIFTEEEPDYYVIIGYTNEKYNPEKSIVLQMEPWVYDKSKLWGVKCWNEWAIPDKNKFMHVHRHIDYLNPAQWFFYPPKYINYKRKNNIIAIVSSKYIDTGHINRVDFIKYVEEQGYDIIDVYGYSNYHNFKNYKGTIEDKSIIQEYKYILSAENNNEYNYATEKLWEAYIAYTLCIYDGCPNIDNYVDPNSYIKINLENKQESLEKILNIISEDIWINRLSSIIDTRKLIIDKYNVLEIINKIIELYNDNILC